MSGREVDPVDVLAQESDDRAGDVLLPGRGGPLPPVSGGYDHRAERDTGFGARPVGPGAGRLRFLVDDLPGDSIAPVGVPLEQFDDRSGGARLVEDDQAHFPVEFLEDAQRLRRQTELAAARPVPGHIPAVGQVVDSGGHREEQERCRGDIRALPGAPAGEGAASRPQPAGLPGAHEVRQRRERSDSRVRNRKKAMKER